MRIKKRMLITGAGGMVGTYIDKCLGDYETLQTDIRGDKEILDVRDIDEVSARVKAFKPQVILHLAAETDVDFCERSPDAGYLSNAIGTQNLALVSREEACTLVYVSTAGVFDGESTEPYTEYSVPRPINVYGASKLAGEEYVKRLVPEHYIIRAGWMVGGGPKEDKKFVGKMVMQMRDGRDEILAVNDKFGTPTYGAELLCGIHAILSSDMFGIYHLTNTGRCSRLDIAEEIRRILKAEHVVVKGVSSAEFPLSAARPRSEVLRNLNLELRKLCRARPWQEVVRHYVESEWMAS